MDLADIIETGVIAAVATAIILVKWRDLLLHAFDPAQARAIGLPVKLMHYGLLSILSLTIVGALKAVGIILVIAMLIAPGTIAFLLTRKFSSMLAIAVIIAVLASFLGVYLSFFINSAPAPTIVLLMTIGFIAAFVVAISKTSRVETREAT